jgi:hypothetical protein
MRGIARWGSVALLALATALATSFIPQQRSLTYGSTTLQLAAPAFVQVASAQDTPGGSGIGSTLDQEAGISAYYKTPDAISLNQVRDLFRTIEAETSDYLLGSVPVPNYVEHFDVHVYVHTSGWILGYYLRNDPVSKIVDWRASTISTTKLNSVVSAVASAAGAPISGVTYYDFRYPNATNILMVAEDRFSGDDFTIELPSSYGYFERSWGLAAFGSPDYFTVDGVNLPNRVYGVGNDHYGTLTASQLLPAVPHTITAEDYGVLVITYRVP